MIFRYYEKRMTKKDRDEVVNKGLEKKGLQNDDAKGRVKGNVVAKWSTLVNWKENHAF